MIDYSHLKGTVVWCYSKNNNWTANGCKKAKGFVADIDYKKGITIKHISTQIDLTCLNRESRERQDGNSEMYKKRFKFFIESIEKGIYRSWEKPGQNPFAGFSGCAFE